MNHPLLTSSRRKFLQACGIIAAAPQVINRAGATRPARTEPDWLREWNSLPRQPVLESRDPIVIACLAAADDGKPLPLYYHGGSTPGRLRKLSPELVFQLPGHTPRYVAGYCHLRQAPRIFRIDHISLA